MGLTFNFSQHSVAANSVLANTLTNQPIEYCGQAATLTLYGAGDTAGATHQFLAVRGPDALVLVPPGAGLFANSTPGTVKTNENFIGQWAIPAGSRLIHTVTNNTGAAVVANFQYLVQ
jgi:hypothetical protein